jgi:hypothetical protein
MCVHHGFIGLAAQPRYDRDPAKAVDHERVMGLADNAGQFQFQSVIQRRENRGLGKVFVCHDPASYRYIYG